MPMNQEQAQSILLFAQIFLRLLADGVITVQKLRQIAKEAGATPEELTDLDRRLSEAIVKRDEELRA